jgi:hypothetical protein
MKDFVSIAKGVLVLLLKVTLYLLRRAVKPILLCNIPKRKPRNSFVEIAIFN